MGYLFIDLSLGGDVARQQVEERGADARAGDDRVRPDLVLVSVPTGLGHHHAHSLTLEKNFAVRNLPCDKDNPINGLTLVI